MNNQAYVTTRMGLTTVLTWYDDRLSENSFSELLLSLTVSFCKTVSKNYELGHQSYPLGIMGILTSNSPRITLIAPLSSSLFFLQVDPATPIHLHSGSQV